MKGLVAALVILVALFLSFTLGIKMASRNCVSAPVNGVTATWCSDDLPQPKPF